MGKEPIKIEVFRAGHWEKATGFRYFVPEEVNREWTWDDGSLNELLEQAARKLGELNAFARLVPNIDLFIHLHVMKEAVLSSRIEGTNTNMDEALLPIEEIEPEKRDDWKEVQRYTKAMNQGIERLAKIPISTRLLKLIHKTLITSARGTHKQPGEFRTSQNWIGGATIADAKFIPPAHSLVNPLMGDLENFLHNKQLHIPALIRIGIAHYQFETIHPFLDGNGRMGRLLITLFLVGEEILDKPLLYLSAFFENKKELYYDNLTNVRERNDMRQWLKYFLVGVERTATKSVETLSAILALKKNMDQAIHDEFGRRHKSAAQLATHLFQDPFVSVKIAMIVCGISKKSAGSLIDAFVTRGWLDEMTGSSRNRVYMFKPYIALFS